MKDKEKSAEAEPGHFTKLHMREEEEAASLRSGAEPLAELEGPGDAQAESPRCQFEQNGERCNRLRASSQYRHAFLANDPVTMLNHEFQRPTEVSASPEPLPCRTPGAVYHFKSAFHGESGRHIITLHIYMPQEIGISEEQAEIIENKLHDASESILSGYWPCNFAAQPVSAKVEEAVRQCAELVVTKPPLSNELIVKLYEQNVANMTERFIAILRPFFTPVSQPPDVKCKNCDLKLTQKVLWLDYMGVEVCQPHISQKLHEPIAAPVTPVSHGPELIEAVKSLLEWMPKYSVGSSGYLRQERVKKALKSFGEGGSLNRAGGR